VDRIGSVKKNTGQAKKVKVNRQGSDTSRPCRHQRVGGMGSMAFIRQERCKRFRLRGLARTFANLQRVMRKGENLRSKPRGKGGEAWPDWRRRKEGYART